MVSDRRRSGAGRVEAALNEDLRSGGTIGKAERAALRAQARAVDDAEHLHDPEVVSKANAVYLDLRRSAGLIATSQPGGDSFAELLAELGRPSTPVGHPENP